MDPEFTSIVIDNGSSETRAGHSSEQLPPVVFPSLYNKTPQGNIVGDDVLEHPEGEIFTILNEGVVYNWDCLEENWKYIFGELGADPTEQPLVLTEEIWNNKKNRSNLAQLAFEKFGVPALAIIKSPLAISYGVGRATSVVVDIGSATTSVTPILDGTILYKGAVHSKYAGDFLNAHINQYLVQKGVQVESFFEGTESFKRYKAATRLLEDFKSSMLSVSAYPIANSTVDFQIAPKYYELPNGDRLEVEREQVFLSEPLFLPANYPLPGQPQNGNQDQQQPPQGLTDLILSSLKKLETSHEVYVSLLSNIVITGGGSLIPGIEQRVLSDLARFLPQYSIQSYSNPVVEERKRSVWLGASILSSMASFDGQFLSKQEYEVTGEDSVNEKFK